MIKYLKYIILSAAFLFLFSATALAADLQQISVFTSRQCPHCQDLEAFLNDYTADHPEVSVKYYRLEDTDTLKLFNDFTTSANMAKVTPIILIGDKLLEGFGSADTTGQKIINLLAEKPADNSFENYLSGLQTGDSSDITEACAIDDPECGLDKIETVSLPLIGEFDPRQYSMPVITSVLGFVDGFNPCAMWVLVVFITLIVQAGDRRKMWELVFVFIVAEALMYYLILNFWYKTWNFVQLDQYITPAIGILSIGCGIYFGYEYFVNKGECKIIDPKTKQQTTSRIQKLITSPLTIGTFFGTILLALSINVIEFACSVGIPQVFTKILDINNYSILWRQLYIVLYTIMYMVDDFVVFFVALYSIQKLGRTTRYAKFCQIIAAITMLILGYFLIFNPGALRF